MTEYTDRFVGDAGDFEVDDGRFAGDAGDFHIDCDNPIRDKQGRFAGCAGGGGGGGGGGAVTAAPAAKTKAKPRAKKPAAAPAQLAATPEGRIADGLEAIKAEGGYYDIVKLRGGRRATAAQKEALAAAEALRGSVDETFAKYGIHNRDATLGQTARAVNILPAEKMAGAAGLHYGDGRITLEAGVADSTVAFYRAHAAGDRDGMVANVDGARVLVHEAMHGFGPAHGGWLQGGGVRVEEVATETAARHIMREEYGLHSVRSLRPVGGPYGAEIDAMVEDVHRVATGKPLHIEDFDGRLAAGARVEQAALKFKARSGQFGSPAEAVSAWVEDLGFDGAQAAELRDRIHGQGTTDFQRAAGGS